jgi:UDP-perosamine 4-acetyltransferase
METKKDFNHPDNLIIVGSGGHSRVVLDAAISAGFNPVGIIDVDYEENNEQILGCPVIGGIGVLDELNPAEHSVIIAFGNNSIRAHYYQQVRNKGFTTPPVIHNTAIISNYSQIGKGDLVNTDVIIDAKSEIGENSIINTAAIVEHDSQIGKHCHVGPGVIIAGWVVIGECAFIGVGTRVIDHVQIGHNVLIGAGSVITKDIPSNSTVVGIPGRVVRCTG